MGSVISINVGPIREVMHNGRPTRTGIWKSPVSGPVALRDNAVEGDEIANLDNHGGPHKAVYVYASEDSQWWRSEHRRIVLPGAMGENLTVEGIDVSAANVGDRWAIGSAVLEVAGPRTPCFKLGLRHEDQDIVEEFRTSLRWGAYMRIVTEGTVSVGDDIAVTPQPAPTMSVGEIARIYHQERERAAELLDVSRISPEWVRFADAELAKLSD
ncbi:MAG: MOSC domain-containing protein [Acidimicrobiia bacterium]|nr:MOSC domain-containing protein [Acidimicrobiia bacterium]